MAQTEEAMSPKKVLLLLISCLGLLTIVAVTEESVRVNSKRQEQSDKKLFDLDYERIGYFTLENHVNGPKIIFRKIEDRWEITEPVRTLADFKVVTSFLVNLQNYSYLKKFDSRQYQKSDYGLEPPQFTLSLEISEKESPGNKTHTEFIYIGHESPVGYGVYVSKAGDHQIYLGGKHLLLLAKKTLNEFRDKYFFKASPDKASMITVSGGGRHRTWNGIDSDCKSDCNKNEILKLVSELKSMRANKISDLKEPFTPGEGFLYEIKWGDERKKEIFGIWLNGGEVSGFYSPDMIKADLPFQVIEFFESVLSDLSDPLSGLADG